MEGQNIQLPALVSLLVGVKAETLALKELLVGKGLITEAEFAQRVAIQQKVINTVLAEQFPQLAMVLGFPFGGQFGKGE
jgi:hypothetical protein